MTASTTPQPLTHWERANKAYQWTYGHIPYVPFNSQDSLRDCEQAVLYYLRLKHTDLDVLSRINPHSSQCPTYNDLVDTFNREYPRK